jgi:hypothetical protein
MSDAERTWTRYWPRARYWNIAIRTAHIVVAGALFGGHVFDVEPQRLHLLLYATIVTGALLLALEAYPHVRWCYELRGLCVLLKMLWLCLIPWLWSYRVPILVAVLIIASVGSHMPRRIRHYSILHQRVLDT